MEPLVKATELKKTYYRRANFFLPRKEVKAVDGVSLEIYPGETVGLVGESGSGKSTLGRLLLRLEEPDAGQILFEGKSLTQLSENEMRKLRRRVQIVFQDPFSSLNPRLTIGQILREPLKVFGETAHLESRVRETLEQVGLREEVLGRYPHEFSGGQRQRIGIARAVILKPDFIVCDEPVSALDVSIQAQILNLLKDLQSVLKFSYLFISHDLRVIRHMSHRVIVMYKGKIVEGGTGDAVFTHPQTEYTKNLLKAVPRISF